MNRLILILVMITVAVGLVPSYGQDITFVGRGNYPRWSPDGKYLSYQSREGVKIYEVETGLTKTLSYEWGYRYDWLDNNNLVFEESWDSTGFRRIEFVKLSLDGDREVILGINDPFDERNIYQLTRLSNGSLGLKHNGCATIDQIRSAFGRAASDSNVYFLTFRRKGDKNDPRKFLGTVINLVNPSGEVLKQIDTDRKYSLCFLSPRGDCFACAYQGAAIVIDTSGCTIGYIDWAQQHSWSPDGKYLVYLKTKDDGHRILESDIFMNDLTGENEIQLTDTPDKLENYPVLSPDLTRVAYFYETATDAGIETLKIGGAPSGRDL